MDFSMKKFAKYQVLDIDICNVAYQAFLILSMFCPKKTCEFMKKHFMPMSH